jgi:hypothetical protein
MKKCSIFALVMILPLFLTACSQGPGPTDKGYELIFDIAAQPVGGLNKDHLSCTVTGYIKVYNTTATIQPQVVTVDWCNNKGSEYSATTPSSQTFTFSSTDADIQTTTFYCPSGPGTVFDNDGGKEFYVNFKYKNRYDNDTMLTSNFVTCTYGYPTVTGTKGDKTGK